MKLSDAVRSDTARRLTNLFAAPNVVTQADTFLEKGLIHRTANGERVRSKSEVIVADLLHSLDVPYAYEQAFSAPDGSVRYPDFTVDDAETGRKLLIEHLGMLDRSDYRRRWAAKEKWYRDIAGVRPAEEHSGGIALLTTSEIGGFDAKAIREKIVAALKL